MNQNHDIYLTERDGKFTRMQCFWINLKSAQDKGSAVWQTRSNASILDNSVPADCLQKVVHTKSEEVRYRKIHLSSRPPPKSYPPECLASSTRRARSTWRQYRRKLVADEMTIEPKIDFRILGFLRAEAEQGEGKGRKELIGSLVH